MFNLGARIREMRVRRRQITRTSGRNRVSVGPIISAGPREEDDDDKMENSFHRASY